MQQIMFRGDDQAQIIQAVNAWLADKGGIAIRHTETTEEEPEPGKTRLLFSIWYEQAP